MKHFVLVLLFFGAPLIKIGNALTPLETLKQRFQKHNILDKDKQLLESHFYHDLDYEVVLDVDPPEVTVPEFGTARGKTMLSYLGRQIYTFQSIPYATPPIGERRFRATEPWTGTWNNDGSIYDASWLRARCPQISLILDVIAGREDCLHLSIYTPKYIIEPGEDPIPVMMFIHGGAYISGDAFLYVPTKLMDRNVMVVVIQYRLTNLGFLAAGSDESPGNMGLMDQVEALKWIHKYIRYFGGDPNKVTVFGQSAGGASSSWMQITPMTRAEANDGVDLFGGVIMMSGSAMEYWTLDPDPNGSLILHAEASGCYDKNMTNDDMVICMRGRSFENVTWASLKVYAEDRLHGGLGFRGQAPVIQNYGNISQNAIVIPEHPKDSLINGRFLKIPTMAGCVRDEGSLVVGRVDDTTGAVGNSMRNAFLYNADMEDWNSIVGGLIDMTGVLFLKSGIWTLAHLINRYNSEVPVYFYSWEFESDDSLFYWIFLSSPDIPVPGGISHADELLFLFHLPSDFDDREREMSRRMLTLWTNFAKYRDPTPLNVTEEEAVWEDFSPRWQQFNITDQSFLLIEDELTMHNDFFYRWNYYSKGTGTTTAKRKKPNTKKLLHNKEKTFEEVDEMINFVSKIMKKKL